MIVSVGSHLVLGRLSALAREMALLTAVVASLRRY